MTTHALIPMQLMQAIVALVQSTPCGTMNARQILNGLESNQCHELDLTNAGDIAALQGKIDALAVEKAKA